MDKCAHYIDSSVKQDPFGRTYIMMCGVEAPYRDGISVNCSKCLEIKEQRLKITLDAKEKLITFLKENGMSISGCGCCGSPIFSVDGSSEFLEHQNLP